MTDRQLPCRAVSGVAQHDKAARAAESGGGGHRGEAGDSTALEEAVAVVTMLLFFGLAQLLPVAAGLAAAAALFLRSAPAATFVALLVGAALLPAGARWQPVLHSRVWDCWRRRFRYAGVVPPVPFCAPSTPHVFAHLPHAVFPMASFLSFPLCGDPGTGVPAPMEGLVATVLMRVPLYKHVFAWMGCCPADRPRMMDLLAAGTSVGVIVEGVAGIFHGATPERERVYLSRRKGFVKAALQAGAPLVPVYHLGASQLLSFAGTASLSRRLRASVGVYWGAHGLPLPRKHDIVSLVGAPLPVPRIEHPTPADVDDLHARFCAALTALFDGHKHLLGPEWEKKVLEIV